jgi:hypothetical protein
MRELDSGNVMTVVNDSKPAIKAPRKLRALGLDDNRAFHSGPHAHRSGRALCFLNMPFECDRQYRQPTLPMATSARSQASFPSDA